MKLKQNYMVLHGRAPWHGAPMPNLYPRFLLFCLWHALADPMAYPPELWHALGLSFQIGCA